METNMNRFFDGLIKRWALFIISARMVEWWKPNENRAQLNQRQKCQTPGISMAWDDVGGSKIDIHIHDINDVPNPNGFYFFNISVGVTMSLKIHLNVFLTNFCPMKIGRGLFLRNGNVALVARQTANRDTVIKLRFSLKKVSIRRYECIE